MSAAARYLAMLQHDPVGLPILGTAVYAVLLGLQLLAGLGAAPAITAVLPSPLAGGLLLGYGIMLLVALGSWWVGGLVGLHVLGWGVWGMLLVSIVLGRGPLGGVTTYVMLLAGSVFILWRLGLELVGRGR